MKNYGYASVVFMVFVWMGSTMAETEETATSKPLSRYFPAYHPCNYVRYETKVNVEKLMGTWYVLLLMCPNWGRVPACDRVQLAANGTGIKLHWENLDMHEDPVYSHSSEYRTTLNVVQSGLWVDDARAGDYYAFLVLSSWHPYYLVIAKCYPSWPLHSQDVFVLSRYTEHVKRDLDMFADMAKDKGVIRNLNKQYRLWSQCAAYL